MSALFANDTFMIVSVSFLIFLTVYFFSDRVWNKIQTSVFAQRDELVRLLELMFVETNSKKILILLLLMSLGLGSVIFLLLIPNIFLALPVSVLAGYLGLQIPKMIIKSMYEKRSGRFVTQMVDGLTIMANGVRSGLSITQSMERVVENMPNPVSQEFALVLSQIRIGRSVEEALIDLGNRIPRPDVQMFVTSVNILKETGGNLAETFTTIAFTIRERQKVEKKIEALTDQGVVQGMIITLVPFILIFMFLFIDPSYIQPMFTTTLGIVFLIMMLLLQLIGGIAIRRIVRVKV
jgi:tight adherence protein B